MRKLGAAEKRMNIVSAGKMKRSESGKFYLKYL